MKKKLLSLLLVMVLVLAYTVPAAAAETEPAPVQTPAAAEEAVPNGDGAGVVSEDADVQAAYDAYLDVKAAMEAKDYGALATAYYAITEITETFTDEQADEWSAIVETEIGTDAFLAELFSAAYIINAVELRDQYKTDPDAATALAFVEAYESCIDAELEINLFDPDIEADYNVAKGDLPTDTVLEIYEAYTELEWLLAWGAYDSDFKEGYDAFEAIIDDAAELTDPELKALADLMGVESAYAAYNELSHTWMLAQMVQTMQDAQEQFLEDPNEDTAENYIETYDVMFDDEMFTKEDQEIFLNFFGTENYVQAESYIEHDLPEEPVTEEDTVDEADDVSDKDVSPETGDDFNAAPFAALMAVSAAVAVLAVKRRKLQ